MGDDVREGVESDLDVKALVENPLAYVKSLDETDKLKDVFPALLRAKGVQQSEIRHAEGDVFLHTLLALSRFTEETPSDEEFGQIEDEHDKLLVILALLYHDTGKRERNLFDGPDHVQESVNHARNELAGYLSEEDLELVVEMITKHDHVLAKKHISYRPNKLYKLFSLGGNLERSRLLLKLSECDALGREIAEGHEAEWGGLESLVQRNIGLYKLLVEQEASGVEFPAQRISRDVRERIKDLLRSAGWEG